MRFPLFTFILGLAVSGSFITIYKYNVLICLYIVSTAPLNERSISTAVATCIDVILTVNGLLVDYETEVRSILERVKD